MTQQVPNLLIDGHGTFDLKFVDDLKLATVSRPVAVVSVFGAQSSGKSTLMNYLHSTNFKVMDASQGMQQTTKGIWVAKCPPNGRHEILALDTEGCDGLEREEDTKFEKQNALFCLAVSNTVIINMKCDNVNLNNGGNWPLLRTVLEVMVRKFCTRRKVNLVFVLRDKNKCPLHKLEEQLKGGLHKIWKGMKKPEAQLNASLEDFFNIQVEALSNFNDKQKQFEDEVAALRERIIALSTAGVGAARKMAASGFADYAREIWDKIKEDKDLDLPHYRIMVAEIRCRKIAEEKYQSFYKNGSWLQIQQEATSGAVQGFGAKVSPIIDIYLSQYDEETRYYDETKRDASRKQLIEKIMTDVKPVYLSVVAHMRHAILKKFGQAAMDELKKNGVLVGVKTVEYIKEFKNQLKDAAVKKANWNQDAEHLAQLQSEIYSWNQDFQHLGQLESEISRILKEIHKANEQLERQKRDKRGFWMNMATTGASVLHTVANVTGVIMAMGAS